MANELVVKDNALINASYSLDTTEQRLILLSIVRARETGQGISPESKLKIYASDYMKQFNVAKSSAYEAMKSAVNNLFSRQFSFIEIDSESGVKKVVKSRWVSQIAYIDELAQVEVIFTPAVVPLITRLEECFTTYQLNQVSQLTSKYAIRLYELLIQWRKLGKTPIFEINDFRSKIGIEGNEYPRMSNFKSFVLDVALKQINDFTDVTAEYEQHKSGRSITGLSFKFKITQEENDSANMAIELTEKQILLFSNKLAYDPEFSSKHAVVGESYQDLEKRLSLLLVDPQNIQKWSDDLKRVGYS